MPEDTKYIINQSQLVDIADAIREKYGEQDTYTVNEMPRLIENIPGVPICTITFKNISTTESLSMRQVLDSFDNGALFYDDNMVKIPYFSYEIDEDATVAPLGTVQFKVLTIPFNNSSNLQKGSTKGVTSSYPWGYFGINRILDSSDFSNLYQDLNNVSVAVVAKEMIKSEEYDIIPYPTDPTKNSSFTVNIEPYKEVIYDAT